MKALSKKEGYKLSEKNVGTYRLAAVLKKQMQQEARRTGNKQLELELTIEIINLTKQLKQAK